MKTRSMTLIMKRSAVLVLLTTGFLLGCVYLSPVKAQQGTETERSLLPDIDPQDIEIRSEFKANFRGLSRQPILGFNPEPRLYKVSPERSPFIESQEERMADLPVVQLSRPTPPQMEFFSYPADGQFYSETGFGSYTSPEARMYGGVDLNEQSSLSAQLNHHSSSGHLVNDFGAFRDFNADLGYHLDLENAGRLNLNVGGEHNFNNLFPAEVNTPLNPDDVDSRNEFKGAHVEARYGQWKNSYKGWSLKGRYDLFEAKTRVGMSDQESREDEGRAHFRYQWTGNRTHEIYRIDVRGRYGQLTPRPRSSEDWYRAGAKVTYQRLLAHETFLSGSIGLQGAGESGGGKLLYPSSLLEAKHWFGENLTLQAQVETRLTNSTLKERYDDNPFLLASTDLAPTPRIQHSYRMGGSVKVDWRIFKRTYLEAKGSFHHIDDYAFYANGPRVSALFRGPGFPNNVFNDFYRTFYEDARIGEFQASLTHDWIPKVFWMRAAAMYRTHKLTDGSDQPIPFVADYKMESRLFVKPISTFRIELWGSYVGPRHNSANTNELDPYLLAGSKFEYKITDHIGAYIKAENIMDEQYQVWEGYQARPLQLYGGVIISL